MTDKPINMTRPLDLTHEKRNVGPQRIQRPIYTDLLPTCNNACPAGENIPGLVGACAGQPIQGGMAESTENNPMPGIHGRVCYHPAKAPAIGVGWMPRSASTRSSAFLVIWRCRKTGSSR